MMSDLQQRVTTLLARRGISQAEASRRGGFKNKAFINDIVRGHKTSVRGSSLEQLAAAFATTEAYLLGKTDNPDPAALAATPQAARQEYEDAPSAPTVHATTYPRDVPIRGICVGGEDADFTVNGETGDYARRPPGLAGRRSVYALYVRGDSMYPAHREGGLIYVDPHRTPAIGEDAIVELHPENPDLGEPGRGFIKRLKRRAGSRMIFEQFNPPLELEFETTEIKNMHRVIPWEEVLGY